MENSELIKSNPVFRCLSQAELDYLESHGIRKQYQGGQYLTHAGDVWAYLFILLSGSISAIKESPEGRTLIATSFKPGEVFWGVSFFHPELPMPVALKVDDACSLFLWSRSQILPVILENGKASWELCCLMVRRMLRASEIVEELAFQPVMGRLARLLIDFTGQARSGPVARSLTLDDMAARIGSTREVVCRFLQRFADEELIKITRTDFEITNRERLASIARKLRGETI
jgi:CRP-like cAMP-binding protein